MPRSTSTLERTTRRSVATAKNPNHHLWLHGRNWWVYCAVNPTHCTKDKLRRSLCTESVEVARFRRDELFRLLQAEGMLGRIRAMARPGETTLRAIEPSPGLTWQQRVDLALATVMSRKPESSSLSASSVEAGQGKLQLCC